MKQRDVHEGGDHLDVNDLLDDGRGVDRTDDSDEVRLSDDDVFEVLYNRRRRGVIRYLRDGDGTATVSDLAEHIAAKENDITVQQLSSYERKRVYVGLYQNHLPMMDEIGVLDYDENRGTVRLRESARRLGPFLEEAGGSTGTRTMAAGAFVLTGAMLLGTLDVGALAAVSDRLWILLGLIGIVGLVVFDVYDPRSR